MAWQVEVRNSLREIVGVVDDYDTLALDLRHNDISTGALTLASTGPAATWLTTPGYGIRCLKDGQHMFGGLVYSMKRTWGGDDDSAEGPGLLQVSVYDDMIHVADRILFNRPGAAFDSATQNDFYQQQQNSNAEDIIKTQVGNNTTAPNALALRRVDGLTIATNLNRGSTVYFTSRFGNLAEEMFKVAERGGLGMKVTQSGTGLVFDVYVPVDRTAEARFSRALGNLQSYEWTYTAPTITHPLVGGGITGGGVRLWHDGGRDTTAESAWKRHIERFIDQRSTVLSAELQAAADDAKVEGATVAGLTMAPVDTPSLTFGTHYNLGDKVTVEVDGQQVQDVVRRVLLTIGPDGVANVAPTVGAVDASESIMLVKMVRRMARRLTALERNY